MPKLFVPLNHLPNMLLFVRVVLPLVLFAFLPHASMGFQEQPAGEDYASLVSQWKTLDGKIGELEKKVGESEENRKTYTQLVSDANDVIEKLRKLTVQHFREGNADIEKLRTLLGIMINDSVRGRGDQVQKLGDELVSLGMSDKFFTAATKSSRLKIRDKELFEELAIRAREKKVDDLPRVKLTTSEGDVIVELFENEAPNTVANFISLVKKKHYDGLEFFRVIEGFMAQGGCPDNNGMGGPGYTIKCECQSPEARNHFIYSLSMAKAPAPDTGGSQFFITFRRTSGLDKRHTVFGRVVSGFDVVDKFTRNKIPQGGQEIAIPNVTNTKIIKAEVLRDRGQEYKPEIIEK